MNCLPYTLISNTQDAGRGLALFNFDCQSLKNFFPALVCAKKYSPKLNAQKTEPTIIASIIDSFSRMIFDTTSMIPISPNTSENGKNTQSDEKINEFHNDSQSFRNFLPVSVFAKITEPTAIEIKNPHQKINPAISLMLSYTFAVIQISPNSYYRGCYSKCDEKINQFHNTYCFLFLSSLSAQDMNASPKLIINTDTILPAINRNTGGISCRISPASITPPITNFAISISTLPNSFFILRSNCTANIVDISANDAESGCFFQKHVIKHKKYFGENFVA